MGKRANDGVSSGEEFAEEPAKRLRSAPSGCDRRRWRELKKGSVGDGPVLYWMSREQRVADNWALIHALETARKKGLPVAVCFVADPSRFPDNARQSLFSLRGLRALPAKLDALNIPFFMFRGDPATHVSALAGAIGAGLVVTDMHPMREFVAARKAVAEAVACPVHEVDAHNVVPVWAASDKREYAARTIRPKIHRLLPEFMTEFPALEPASKWTAAHRPTDFDWDGILAECTQVAEQTNNREVSWCVPGEAAAMDALVGEENGFLTNLRLKLYANKRNDPALKATSNLSPYLNQGQLAPQRAALEANKLKRNHSESVASFLEELVVRRELSDNFVFYEPNYDNLECAADWAKETLRVHSKDKREYVYSRAELEQGKTHDDLWNAAQLQLTATGKIHGFMRMYWAKKILEWTEGPEQAIEFAIFFNDRYALDGRDPNGFVGCMWSTCGIHDMGWTERPVFGKIRYMNYNGCKRKFKVDDYIAACKRDAARERGETFTEEAKGPFAKAKAAATKKKTAGGAAGAAPQPMPAPAKKVVKKAVRLESDSDSD